MTVEIQTFGGAKLVFASDYAAVLAALTASDAQSAALQARLKLVEERARQAEELLEHAAATLDDEGLCDEPESIRAFLAASEPRQGEGNE